jgi:hypothetical protein
MNRLNEDRAAIGARAWLIVGGHLCGLLLALCAVASAPRIMDGVMCLAAVTTTTVDPSFCKVGASGFGEGGLALSWKAIALLCLLVGIMETAVWLRDLYRAPSWMGPLVVLCGGTTLLSLTMWPSDAGVASIPIAFVFCVPLTLAFTAYWIPLLAVRRLGDSGGRRA